ncbi:hypothetical protein N7526_002857 [Penicillium atrosanguineum]|nr:hypothetical protein N7526_002857 [Penicillium atrosanguineum]
MTEPIGLASGLLALAIAASRYTKRSKVFVRIRNACVISLKNFKPEVLSLQRRASTFRHWISLFYAVAVPAKSSNMSSSNAHHGQVAIGQIFGTSQTKSHTPGVRDPRVNIFQPVENWIWDGRKEKWVCVLDNVDNEFLCSFSVVGKNDTKKGLTNASTKPLLEYVRRSRRGSTIITSRSRDIALRMIDHKDVIEVKPMDALESIPLAILYSKSSASLFGSTISDFQKSDREVAKLLRTEVGYAYRNWEAKNLILVTWQISFDYIRQTKPSTAELLSLKSFFDRQGILKNLVRPQPKADDISSSELRNDSSDGETSKSDIGPNFEDDVTTLRDYSFISVSEDSILFMMHRNVEQWREKFIDNLHQESPIVYYKT